MKVVFSVTSSGCDEFEVMTRLALSSLRMTNPEITAIIAIDPDTHQNLITHESTLLRDTDGVVIIQTPEGNQTFRNRFVRTSVRANIEGDYLHLDSDILVRGRLDKIFESPRDVAAALNHSQESYEKQVWIEDIKANEHMGWRISSVRNLNAGIVFLRDTAQARRLCKLWNQKLTEAYQKLERPNDQAPFNAALEELGITPTVLDSRYNAQFQMNPSVATNAVIWHFYGMILSRELFPPTRYEEVVARLLRGEKLSDGHVYGLIESRHPWLEENGFDRVVVNSLLKKSSMECWQAELLRIGAFRYISKVIAGLPLRAANSLMYRLKGIRKRI